MKVILSRKGFDQKHGGMPSPIMPDGTLLLLPQPCETGHLRYDDIIYNGQSYLDIICSLRPKLATTLRYSHTVMNPDLQSDRYLTPPDWKPAYGQFGPAESHLHSRDISVGDIFLYYGWFKQTMYDESGQLRFIESAPDLHIIFAYLQIGAIITNNTYISRKYYWHANAHIDNYKKKHNTIYIPTRKLSYSNHYDGCGILPYSKKLVLTKEGYSYSKWDLPNFLASPDVKISYHNNVTNGFLPGKEYFQSANIGGEFVINGTFDLKNWVRHLLIDEESIFTKKMRNLNQISHMNYPDQNGKIYCRKRNKVININTENCSLCKGLRNMLGTDMVECRWNDYLTSEEDAFQVRNPSEEYHRVNWLIEKQFLPDPPTELE